MTRKTTFGKHSFSINRWDVGQQTPDAESVDKYWERFNAKSDARAAKFKRGRIKKGLRNILMSQNPHCADCGLRLQALDRDQTNYCCVMGVENPVLCCHDCANERGKGPKKSASVVEPFGAGVLVESEVASC